MDFCARRLSTLCAGPKLIIHAGDIGGQEILDALQDLAPVVAVRGNTDHGSWADALPETAVAEAGASADLCAP